MGLNIPDVPGICGGHDHEVEREISSICFEVESVLTSKCKRNWIQRIGAALFRIKLLN